MDIWTERLERRHLPLLEQWIGRTSGEMTANDFPKHTENLSQWIEKGATESARQDFLVSIYETPVGLAGLRQKDRQLGTTEYYLLLFEVNYNLIRTATYATMRMLDQAFQNTGVYLVRSQVFAQYGEYLNALERMGFSQEAEESGRICVTAEKKQFLSRKYLF